MRVDHGFGPVYDGRSRILVLGSFPSVKSREQAFYYGHPQNRFWPLLAKIFGDEPGMDPDARRDFCLRHRVALWDVIQRCEITGSSDSSIRNVEVTNLRLVLDACDIQAIYANGATAHRLYARYQQPLTGLEAIRLPSTSPANASWTMDRLYGAWRILGFD